METLRLPAHYPVPAVRKNKVKPTAPVVIAQRINDIPKPVACNLSRNSPGNRPVAKIKKPTSPVVKKASKHYENVEITSAKVPTLSDDDDFDSKLTFDEAEQSLEDEIFEELEKVAHDEAKLNAAIENFDKILNEYNDKRARKEERPSAIPKPLQKSKTCSIIESKCILKKHQLKKSNTTPQTKVDQPIRVENIDTNIPSANYFQLTKSLWNLEDFESFAKSAATDEKCQRTPMRPQRARSVWEISPSLSSSTPRPAYSRQASISKIPIKSSSNLSASMMQLNTAASAAPHPSPTAGVRLKKSAVYASTLGLSTPLSNHQSHKLTVASSSRRSSLGIASHPSKSISNYAETKASLQRRNLMSSCNSINKVPTGIKTNSSPHAATTRQSQQLKSAKSEMSIHGKFAMKAKQLQSSIQRKSDQNRIHPKVKRDGNDTVPVKGPELPRKVEEFSDVTSATRSNAIVSGKKRDYIAKERKTVTKGSSSDVSVHTKSRDSSACVEKMMTNRCEAGNDDNNGSSENMSRNESETSVDETLASITVTTKIITIETPLIADEQLALILSAPTLESSNVIPDVLGGRDEDKTVIKDYSSDCSDDSGHISNENEDVTVSMELKKPVRKISEELLEIFEKKAKPKVAELNNVNLIKSTMEIYPTFNNNSNSKVNGSNKACKSEVTIFINKY
jgi:hypothetical protein